MATKTRTKTPKVFTIDAPMGEAITALVREELTAQGKGAALARQIARVVENTETCELTAEDIAKIREQVNSEIVRQRPDWGAPAGDSVEIKAERKRRSAKVRTTANRIMSALRSALRDEGIATPEPVRVGGRKAGTGKAKADAEGRTSKTDAARAAESVVVAAGDAAEAIKALQALILSSLRNGDYVTVIAAAEKAIKVQDAE